MKRVVHWIDDIDIFELYAKIRDSDDQIPEDAVILERLEEEMEDIRVWIHENGLDLDD